MVETLAREQSDQGFVFGDPANEEVKDLWEQFWSSIESKTFFFQFQQLFMVDESLKQFYRGTFLGSQNCDYLSQFGYCQRPDEKLTLELSPKMHFLETFYLIQWFKRKLEKGACLKALFEEGTFVSQLLKNLVRSFSVNELNVQMSEKIADQIAQMIEQVNRDINILFILEVLFTLITFIVFYFLVYNQLFSLSMQNHQFLNVIPLDIIINNQYFKVNLNSKQF